MNKLHNGRILLVCSGFLIALCANLTAYSANASELTIPNTFTAGTPAVADEVNANFAAVETAVNDNDGRIAALEAQIQALEALLTTLQAEVTTLQAEVTTLEAASVPNLNMYLRIDETDPQIPTVWFEAVNVKIVNGLGATAGAVNGLGNLVVGYDERRGPGVTDKSGSHNLVVGPEHNYTSYGGFIAGLSNTTSAPNASVAGGTLNTAFGANSSISGGRNNGASDLNSSVSGGSNNVSSGVASSVSGGTGNVASGFNSSVSGGRNRTAPDNDNWAAGGLFEGN